MTQEPVAIFGCCVSARGETSASGRSGLKNERVVINVRFLALTLALSLGERDQNRAQARCFERGDDAVA